jgi:predicted RNase H-like nuclease
VWVAGVDGCRAGWVVALAPVDLSSIRVRIVERIQDVLDAPEGPAVIAVDMPIGLPERIVGSGRRAEQLVRPLLGARQSSVFAIPGRAAVYAPDYGEACRRALSTSEPPRKVSRQGFGLFARIREVDAVLLAQPEARRRLYEVHPEVAFWTMNQERALDQPKKAKGGSFEPGLALRRSLLVSAGLPRDAVAGLPPRGAAADDLLDALAGLVVARAILDGRGRSFPDPPEQDQNGNPVAIWTFWPALSCETCRAS